MSEPRVAVHNRRANLVLAAAWTLFLPVCVTTGWIYSVALVSAASLYANAVGHVSAWAAADDRAILERLERIEKLLEQLAA